MASDMNYFYNVVIPQDERSRVESLEPFDEYEEWHLKCAHYMLLTAFSGSCQPLAPLVWPQGSSHSTEIDGDVSTSKNSRSTTDIDCGMFVAMSKQSSTSGTAKMIVSRNGGEVGEPTSSDGTKSISSEMERNQSLSLQDGSSELPVCDAALYRHGSDWRSADLAFIGEETDTTCQRFGHTADIVVINGQRHLVTVGGFGVASCGRHRRLSNITAWNLSTMTPVTYSVDNGSLLSRVCHATVTLGNSAFGNSALGSSSLVVVGGRHSPASPVREHVVLVEFTGSSADTVTCHEVVCSGDVPDPCWRHTVGHAVIDGALIT